MTRTRANQQKDKDKDARSRETRASLSNYVIFYKMAMIQGVFFTGSKNGTGPTQ